MSEEESQAFVVKAVGHALARDGSSGGCIRTVTITKDGVKRSFLPNDQVCSSEPALYISRSREAARPLGVKVVIITVLL